MAKWAVSVDQADARDKALLKGYLERLQYLVTTPLPEMTPHEAAQVRKVKEGLRQQIVELQNWFHGTA